MLIILGTNSQSVRPTSMLIILGTNSQSVRPNQMLIMLGTNSQISAHYTRNKLKWGLTKCSLY